MKKIISVDAETNGLWGTPFQVAMVLYEGEIEIERLSVRCPIVGKVNLWVEENVLPQIKSIKETHNSYESMLQDVAKFWLKHKDGTMLVHMGFIVESFLFREMVRLGYIGVFDAPYTYIELAEVLRLRGEKEDSVDSYIDKYNLDLPIIEGGSHNALYDCIAAHTVWKHLKNGGYNV